MDPLLSVGGTAVVSAIFLQWLKNSKWFPWLGIQPNFERANAVASVIIAGITSVGVSYAYDHTTGEAVIKLSTHQLWHWALQWASQHVAYKTLVVPTELLAAVVNLLKGLQADLSNLQKPGA